MPCDGRQISQALTNLLQNAVDSIEGRPTPEGGTLPPGQIDLSLEVHDDRVAIVIADNGKGLPHEERDRLTEPYVTTRAKGTGLGSPSSRRSWRIMAENSCSKTGPPAWAPRSVW